MLATLHVRNPLVQLYSQSRVAFIRSFDRSINQSRARHPHQRPSIHQYCIIAERRKERARTGIPQTKTDGLAIDHDVGAVVCTRERERERSVNKGVATTSTGAALALALARSGSSTYCRTPAHEKVSTKNQNQPPTPLRAIPPSTYRWHVFLRERVRGVRDQQAGLAL